ncbi:HsdM family class I SAM-dependent methyltransferase [Taibaiella koreensis]|uniref:HsdM family class I SAM-dependent methyltransferase n=1 Tax=Taibaiella koreensis TaxID=1268548 RepID=UPI000E59FFF7|nr:N-6 DNA methylase [Taibaiella koreensis]
MSWKPEDILAATWSSYSSSGRERNRNSFYDFTLSIIGWQILEQARGKSEEDTTYSFNAVVQAILQTEDTTLLEKALHYWDAVLQQQKHTEVTFSPGLLSINHEIIRNLPSRLLNDILGKWADYFSSSSKQSRGLLMNLLNCIGQEGNIQDGLQSTPRELGQMMAAYIRHTSKNPVNVYDPFPRTGDLLATTIQEWHTIKQVQGGYTWGLELKLATLRLLCSFHPETEITLINNPDIPAQPPKQFDIILCNPPFGARFGNNAQQQVYNESLAALAQKTSRLDVLFLGHILDSLSGKGHAAVLLPAIFISGNSLGKEIITALLAQNVLDMVIELPPGLFTHTNIAPVLFCLSKTRSANQSVWLVDATTQAQKQNRQAKLNLETVLQWLNQIKNNDTEGIKEITAVSPADITAHEYNLYRMIHSQDTSFQVFRKSSAVLYQQCLQLEQDIAAVRKKMEALIAKPL